MANTTDKSILTAAGKALLAQLNAEEKPLIIDKMIFANVPNRPEFPQPDDVVPPDHIVHQEQVEQRGRLSADSVIYSSTLTSDVGPFDFNWTGAYCSEYGVLVTIDHHALTPKTADEPGVAGNTLVRSVVLEYKDIAEITNITVDASSWQYNATERMKKMDSDVAQSIIDQNGKDWFIEDGFLVTPQARAFNIKEGAGYVSGNRVTLEFDRNVQVPNKPSFIYVDAHRGGTPTGEQVTLFDFVVTAEEKGDYIDANGVKHFVCKIAQVLGDGSVSDLRPDSKGADKEYTNIQSGASQNQLINGNVHPSNINDEAKLNDMLPMWTHGIRLNGTLYRLSKPCSGELREINILSRPYSVKVSDETVYLMNVNYYDDNIVNVEAFWPVSDGITDDTPSWEGAVASMNGRSILRGRNANYRITRGLNFSSQDGVVIDLTGSNVYFDSNLEGEHLFTLHSKQVQSKSLSQAVSKSDGSIILTGTDGINKDSLITIKSDEVWYKDNLRENRKGELLKVNEVVGNEVFIHGRALFDYEQEATVEVITPIKHVSVKGGSIVGTGAINKTGVFGFSGILDLRIKNVSLSDINSAIGFRKCADVKIKGCNFDSIDLIGLGYSVNIGPFNLNVSVTNCDGDRGRHFVTTTAEDGVTKTIKISNNNFRGSRQYAIDTHAQGYDVTISDNKISDSNGGIQTRSPSTTIMNNDIRNCLTPYNSEVTSDKNSVSGILVGEMGLINLEVLNNTIRNDSRFGNKIGGVNNYFKSYGHAIDIRPNANVISNEEFINEKMVVKGNTCHGWTNGSNLVANLAGTPNLPAEVVISDNDFSSKSGYTNVALSFDKEKTNLRVSGNHIGVSARGKMHCVISNVGDLVFLNNTFRRFAQENLEVFDVKRASIDAVKPLGGTNHPDWGFAPKLTNVDDCTFNAFGIGLETAVLPKILSAAVYEIFVAVPSSGQMSKFYATIGTGVNQRVVKNFDADGNGSSATISDGVVTITQAQTFYWTMTPVVFSAF